jgi:hypothetical protein
VEPADLLAGNPVALSVFDRVRAVVTGLGPCEVRTTKSQVAFRPRRGFAYLWVPGNYLRAPTAPVVLSVALGRQDGSPRWKQVAHPSPAHWMHHLELHDAAEVDEEVVGWLREAAARA